MEGSASGKVFQTGKPLVLSGPAWRDSELYQVGAVAGFQSGCFLPLISRHRILGVLQLTRLQEQSFTQDDVEFLGQVANQVAIAVENALDYLQVTESHERMAHGQSAIFEDEIRTAHHFNEIIGEERCAAGKCYKQVEVVAPYRRHRPSSRGKPAPAKSSSPAPSIGAAPADAPPSSR